MQTTGHTFIAELSKSYRLTFQEARLLSAIDQDLTMWQATPLEIHWQHLEARTPPQFQGPQRKKRLIKALRELVKEMKRKPVSYGRSPRHVPRRDHLSLATARSTKNIFGNCPVASPKTVCCNLKTIDAVENCAFGCSYCTIQTFYGERVSFDSELKEKLAKIKLDPHRFYHIGTGQSSDSLVWGNRGGMLDALCDFARTHPHILLEFKTKSDHVSYFMDHDIPHNIVCSWSLNTEPIIQHEEHFTASLQQRLHAARRVADRGVKVAFHFHPMVYHEGWGDAYPQLAQHVQTLFRPDEVLFISFGTLTFIQPVIQAIRARGAPSQVLRMEMVKDPHGKLTYPDEIKAKLFTTMHHAFAPWHEHVFMYLCMERADIWDRVFGWHYPTNEEFEAAFGRWTMPKCQTARGSIKQSFETTLSPYSFLPR